jgi:hypothetical protein
LSNELKASRVLGSLNISNSKLAQGKLKPKQRSSDKNELEIDTSGIKSLLGAWLEDR